MKIVNKDIPLCPREISDAKAAEKLSPIDTLPAFLLELFLRAKIKDMRAAALKITLPEVKIENEIVKSEYKVDAGKGQVSVYFYRRRDLSKQAPLLYFIHGGGFVGGTYLANESYYRQLADRYDVVCASIEYHLAPEVQFPYALNECEQGVLHLLKNEETARYIDRDRVFISGDSAGGNLAIATTLFLKNKRDFFPAGQILFYPVTELKEMSTDSYSRPSVENRRMYKALKVTRKMYATRKADYSNFYCSPLLSTKEDDSKPTPALILQAERDGLLDDGVLYGKHLEQLGGKVRCVVYKGAFHAFLNGLGESAIAEDSFQETVAFMELAWEN